MTSKNKSPQFLGLGASSGFTWGVGDRQASVHVPLTSLVNRCGGYEDRRPGASMDPYLVLMMLVSSALQIALPKGYGEGSNRSSGSALQFIPGRGAGAGMVRRKEARERDFVGCKDGSCALFS